jgi:hypothetical protein
MAAQYLGAKRVTEKVESRTRTADRNPHGMHRFRIIARAHACLMAQDLAQLVA